MHVALDRGADVNQVDRWGCTALHYSADNFRFSDGVVVEVDEGIRLRTAQMLVAHGINVEAVSHDGRTALAFAEAEFPEDWGITVFLSGLHRQERE
mmetsp:Transcript_4646/g.9342  ORF Transcript_4646/g.9342 Transcript_4646/m.9342 type:complete len:96 (+) Transcript_4646:1655-1942(+)